MLGVLNHNKFVVRTTLLHVKVHPITCYEGKDGEQRYISTLSLISALDEDGWLTLSPCRFTRGNDAVSLA
jgi:hypothetical protein